MIDISSPEIRFKPVDFKNKISPPITGGFQGLLVQFSEHVNSLNFEEGKK